MNTEAIKKLVEALETVMENNLYPAQSMSDQSRLQNLIDEVKTGMLIEEYKGDHARLAWVLMKKIEQGGTLTPHEVQLFHLCLRYITNMEEA